MQIYAGNLTVFVGGVVINSLAGIAAGGVQGDLITVVVHPGTAARLGDSAEDFVSEALFRQYRHSFFDQGVEFGFQRIWQIRLVAHRDIFVL